MSSFQENLLDGSCFFHSITHAAAANLASEMCARHGSIHLPQDLCTCFPLGLKCCLPCCLYTHFFLKKICLFGCTGSLLKHTGSSLRHAGFSAVAHRLRSSGLEGPGVAALGLSCSAAKWDLSTAACRVLIPGQGLNLCPASQDDS